MRRQDALAICRHSSLQINCDPFINPFACRTAKTLWSFGHPECNRVNMTFQAIFQLMILFTTNIIPSKHAVSIEFDALYPYVSAIVVMADTLE